MELDIKNAMINLVNWTKAWFATNGPTSKYVIGLSGGKDSTLAAMIGVEALGKDRVVALLMPNGTQMDIDDSRAIAEALGIEYHEINIENPYKEMLNIVGNGLGETQISEQTRVNLAPRLRMATLYAYSQSVNGRVVNTCNMSENWVGYSTRWGDECGDFAPLHNLTKTEVVEIGKLLCQKLNVPVKYMEKAPSDGLTGKTDEDNFGFTYDELDKYLHGEEISPDAQLKIEKMHDKNAFKAKPIAAPTRQELNAEILADDTEEILVVIDMQNDFLTGVLGNKECAEVVPGVVAEINNEKYSKILYTLDTHTSDYLNTQEGKNLPVVHCVKNTEGWKLDANINKAIESRQENGTCVREFQKPTFASEDLARYLHLVYESNLKRGIKTNVTLIGVCTGICVLNNASMIKGLTTELPVNVIADKCACVTPNSHKTALDAMKVYQVNII